MSNYQTRILQIDSQYLPSSAYFGLLLNFDKVILEAKENFVKASYRNRAYISGPNGKMRLSVPLVRGKDQRTVMDKVRISYDYDWRKIHWQSLCTSYRRSPYFEYYEDDFEPVYQEEYEFLFQLNNACFELFIRLLDLKIDWDWSSQYSKNVQNDTFDGRHTFHPRQKLEVPGLRHNELKYQQVFEDRNAFITGTSILDLLFNEGPNSRDLIRKCWTEV